MNKLGFNGSGFDTLGFRGKLIDLWKEVVRFALSIKRVWSARHER